MARKRRIRRDRLRLGGAPFRDRLGTRYRADLRKRFWEATVDSCPKLFEDLRARAHRIATERFGGGRELDRFERRWHIEAAGVAGYWIDYDLWSIAGKLRSTDNDVSQVISALTQRGARDDELLATFIGAYEWRQRQCLLRQLAGAKPVVQLSASLTQKLQDRHLQPAEHSALRQRVLDELPASWSVEALFPSGPWEFPRRADASEPLSPVEALPMIGEEEGEFMKRAHEHWLARVSILRDLNYVENPVAGERGHFKWLVLYQICGMTPAEIRTRLQSENAHTAPSHVRTIKSAIGKLALRLGLKVRPFATTGRPKGVRESGPRHKKQA